MQSSLMYYLMGEMEYSSLFSAAQSLFIGRRGPPEVFIRFLWEMKEGNGRGFDPSRTCKWHEKCLILYFFKGHVRLNGQVSIDKARIGNFIEMKYDILNSWLWLYNDRLTQSVR